jgi:hypothetical protein
LAPLRLAGPTDVARLIAEHGRDDHGHLAPLIAHDCPKILNPSANIYDRCGVHFPELPKWF